MVLQYHCAVSRQIFLVYYVTFWVPKIHKMQKKQVKYFLVHLPMSQVREYKSINMFFILNENYRAALCRVLYLLFPKGFR